MLAAFSMGKISFPDVSFAEDQIWAKTIIEAGFKKAFARNSLVKHSHGFGPIRHCGGVLTSLIF